jgi:UDP-N-acetyl-D-glucosamine dehydrogenase
MFICDRMGLDVWEVVAAAGTKPFGFQTFYPGPGVGGHCIPVDPFYLTWKAKEFDFYSSLIETAVQINVEASYYVAQKVWRTLNQRGKSIFGSRVLVLGAAYKKDIDDWRESPAVKIMSIMSDKGADVVFHDPYIPAIKLPKRTLSSVELTAEEVAGADCVVIATDHTCFDYNWLINHAGCVVDARNATKDVRAGRDKITKI